MIMIMIKHLTHLHRLVVCISRDTIRDHWLIVHNMKFLHSSALVTSIKHTHRLDPRGHCS